MTVNNEREREVWWNGWWWGFILGILLSLH